MPSRAHGRMQSRINSMTKCANNSKTNKTKYKLDDVNEAMFHQLSFEFGQNLVNYFGKA